ncbi:MAG TPA: hypothetical protein VMY36_00035 [Patescibacteria group bacterium]|nr:hypothetical protein [Patescibacteria group bacterium]
MTLEIKELVDEIEKRTNLYFEVEDAEGNLVAGGLYTVEELIKSLKRLEGDHQQAIQALKKKVRQEVIKGNVIELPVKLEDKVIEGDLYLLGENQIVTNCVFSKKDGGLV